MWEVTAILHYIAGCVLTEEGMFKQKLEAGRRKLGLFKRKSILGGRRRKDKTQM